MLTLVLLPGMDGTGDLFDPFVAAPHALLQAAPFAAAGAIADFLREPG